MSTQEIRQFGVVLVAAGPGLVLAAFVAGMTLPLFDVARVFIAAAGVVAVFGVVAIGLVMTSVTEVFPQAKALRMWTVVSVIGGVNALSTLYTDHPEEAGLLTSLSSVVFTVVVLTSVSAVVFAAVQVEQSVKSWGVVTPELAA
jgi:hypothetical protein